MADVFQKIKPGNDIVNGGAVVGANMLGNYHSIPPKFNEENMAQQSGILDGRFDDYNYYTA